MFYLEKTHHENKIKKLRQQQPIQKHKEEDIKDLEKKFDKKTIDEVLGDY